MALLFWDASAMAKRYTEEAGHDTADSLFAHSTGHTMATTPGVMLKHIRSSCAA
jgi:hypothetical protein